MHLQYWHAVTPAHGLLPLTQGAVGTSLVLPGVYLRRYAAQAAWRRAWPWVRLRITQAVTSVLLM